MTSRYKFSSFSENKRSASISTTKALLMSAKSSLSGGQPKATTPDEPQTAAAANPSNSLSLLPFRYALASDGVHSSNEGTNSSLAAEQQPQHHSSSSLSGRYYTTTNGGSLKSDIDGLPSDESIFKKNESISSQSDLDLESRASCFLNTNSPKSIDRKRIIFFQGGRNPAEDKTADEVDEENDTFMDQSHFANKTPISAFNSESRHQSVHAYNSLDSELSFDDESHNAASPLRLDDECSALKRYGIRRHHSAPQSDAKWLQVGVIIIWHNVN